MPQRKRETHRPLTNVTGFGHLSQQISRTKALESVGEVIYAARVGDTIKIGHTTNLALRLIALRADEVLAFRPGTYREEQDIHASLRDHLHHDREWYYPTPAVMRLVNQMRETLGLAPVA